MGSVDNHPISAVFEKQERGLEKPVGYNMPDVYDDEDNKGQAFRVERVSSDVGRVGQFKQEESWENDGIRLELYSGANMWWYDMILYDIIWYYIILYYPIL